MLRRQNSRGNTTLCPRKYIIFFFVILCTPVVYLIIGSTDNQYQYVDRMSSAVLEKETSSTSINDHPSESVQNKSLSSDTSFSSLIANQVKGFSISENDVLVFVHIQKTAGTSFEKFLVRHLNIEQPCRCVKGKKRCTCNRPNKDNEIWLFSRYSTGWLCGLHADFTELYVSGCVDHMLNKKEGTRRSRRYFYTTFLREPISRFISEYRHVNRGATWIASRHICNGRAPSSDELPLCFDPNVGWDDVSLNEFLHCPFNLAFNRQTRMLADLTLVNCYSRNGTDPKTRDRILLESAKRNLMNMTFFGIKERMDDSQMMFEQVFNISFNRRLSAWNRSKSSDTSVNAKQMQLIRKNNELDIELYDYAVKLFDRRLAAIFNRTLPIVKEVNGRFGSFEFKSRSDQTEMQFIRNDAAGRRRRVLEGKSKNVLFINGGHESGNDDDHPSDETVEDDLYRV